MIERIKQDWMPFIAFVLLGICVLLLFKRCPSTQPALAQPDLRVRDSFRTVIKFHDSVRVNYITKWRNRTHLVDSSPCYTEVKTIIAECDTIIKVDSILISSLKDQANNDSVIIFKQGLMLRADSIHIAKLNKKVKRNRRIALGLGAVLAGAVGVKVLQ
jgi:hypothetical protein